MAFEPHVLVLAGEAAETEQKENDDQNRETEEKQREREREREHALLFCRWKESWITDSRGCEVVMKMTVHFIHSTRGFVVSTLKN